MKSVILVLMFSLFISCGKNNESGANVNGRDANGQYGSLATEEGRGILFSDNNYPSLFKLEFLKNNTYRVFDIYNSGLAERLSGSWSVKGTSVVLKNLGEAIYYDLSVNGVKSRCIQITDKTLNRSMKITMDQAGIDTRSGYRLSFCRR